ncbi:MAG: glycoside hydrolase family 13 protein, partial [Clostridia bacterium]|nr:glycoside hydrolase family 13 protein [Clostridia bacterium]
VNENDPGFVDFITGAGGVIDRWMACGVSGFRLDVADELPDGFIEKVRSAVKRNDPEALLLGEVWEDASNKISYGVRRKYFLGNELDSVMNYPFRSAIIDFALGGKAEDLNETVIDICGNYPAEALNVLMNPLSTHDTERILSILGGKSGEGLTREEQLLIKLSPEELELARRRLKLAAVLQYSLPGVPSIYYGDEAGCQGLKDPFCRCTYPWEDEDQDLLDFFSSLGQLRRSVAAFRDGVFCPVSAMLGVIAFRRSSFGSEVFVIANNSENTVHYTINENVVYKTLFGCVTDAEGRVIIDGLSAGILIKENDEVGD